MGLPSHLIGYGSLHDPAFLSGRLYSDKLKKMSPIDPVHVWYMYVRIMVGWFDQGSRYDFSAKFIYVLDCTYDMYCTVQYISGNPDYYLSPLSISCTYIYADTPYISVHAVQRKLVLLRLNSIGESKVWLVMHENVHHLTRIICLYRVRIVWDTIPAARHSCILLACHSASLFTLMIHTV